jgi:hypothetical protein
MLYGLQNTYFVDLNFILNNYEKRVNAPNTTTPQAWVPVREAPVLIRCGYAARDE